MKNRINAKQTLKNPRVSLIRRWFSCSLLLLVTGYWSLVTDVYAGPETGATSANFLKIPVAVIPSALGQSYTAMISPDSILFNPAGLGLLSYSCFSGSHNQYVVGIRQEYAAITYRSKYGAVGLGFSMLDSGDIPSYDQDDILLGNTDTSHQFIILSVSQSFPNFPQDRGKLDPMIITPNWTRIEPVTDYRPKVYRFSIGASAKSVAETLDDLTSKTYTFDFGALLVLPHHFQIGASFLNAGGKQKFFTSSYEVSSVSRFGIAKDFHTVGDIMIFTLIGDMVKESDKDRYGSFGIETDILRLFQFRMGYVSRKDEGSKISGGLGLNLDRFTEKENIISGARVDYAYLNYGDFGATHRIGFQLIW
ncbi:MAG: hypothetical protein HY746_00355 [Elusimicrobia bacterium]|nr:hypothetical protein [Elusimicrobiota bacterium]